MDVQMPVLDGVEATRRIRAIPHLADLPVIAMTAQVFGEDRRRSLAAGMSDHITKPIEPLVLLSTAERWFRAPTGADGARRPDQTVE
jgi:CheY-like chemotaxis protein